MQYKQEQENAARGEGDANPSAGDQKDAANFINNKEHKEMVRLEELMDDLKIEETAQDLQDDLDDCLEVFEKVNITKKSD